MALFKLLIHSFIRNDVECWYRYWVLLYLDSSTTFSEFLSHNDVESSREQHFDSDLDKDRE